MRGTLKVMGFKNKMQVLKKLRQECDFSFWPLAQFITGTNRSLS